MKRLRSALSLILLLLLLSCLANAADEPATDITILVSEEQPYLDEQLDIRFSLAINSILVLSYHLEAEVLEPSGLTTQLQLVDSVQGYKYATYTPKQLGTHTIRTTANIGGKTVTQEKTFEVRQPKPTFTLTTKEVTQATPLVITGTIRFHKKDNTTKNVTLAIQDPTNNYLYPLCTATCIDQCNYTCYTEQPLLPFTYTLLGQHTPTATPATTPLIIRPVLNKTTMTLATNNETTTNTQHPITITITNETAIEGTKLILQDMNTATNTTRITEHYAPTTTNTIQHMFTDSGKHLLTVLLIDILNNEAKGIAQQHVQVTEDNTLFTLTKEQLTLNYDPYYGQYWLTANETPRPIHQRVIITGYERCPATTANAWTTTIERLVKENNTCMWQLPSETTKKLEFLIERQGQLATEQTRPLVNKITTKPLMPVLLATTLKQPNNRPYRAVIPLPKNTQPSSITDQYGNIIRNVQRQGTTIILYTSSPTIYTTLNTAPTQNIPLIEKDNTTATLALPRMPGASMTVDTPPLNTTTLTYNGSTTLLRQNNTYPFTFPITTPTSIALNPVLLAPNTTFTLTGAPPTIQHEMVPIASNVTHDIIVTIKENHWNNQPDYYLFNPQTTTITLMNATTNATNNRYESTLDLATTTPGTYLLITLLQDGTAQATSMSKLIITNPEGGISIDQQKEYVTTPGEELIITHQLTNLDRKKSVIINLDVEHALPNIKFYQQENDLLSLLVDNDLDGLPDTGILQPGASTTIVAKIITPKNTNETRTTITFTATTKEHNTTITDTITYIQPQAFIIPTYHDLALASITRQNDTVIISIRNNDEEEHDVNLSVTMNDKESFDQEVTVQPTSTQAFIVPLLDQREPLTITARLQGQGTTYQDINEQNNNRTRHYNTNWTQPHFQRIRFPIKEVKGSGHEHYYLRAAVELPEDAILETLSAVLPMQRNGTTTIEPVDVTHLSFNTSTKKGFFLLTARNLPANWEGDIYLYFDTAIQETPVILQKEPGIIIDNADSIVRTLGRWIVDYLVPGYYKANYLHDFGRAKGEKTITIAPAQHEAFSPSTYEVYSYQPRDDEFSTNVQFHIHHATGTDELTLNQRIEGSKWRYLGFYELNEESAIVITNERTNGIVVFDALKLLNVHQYTIGTGTETKPGVSATNKTTHNHTRLFAYNLTAEHHNTTRIIINLAGTNHSKTLTDRPFTSAHSYATASIAHDLILFAYGTKGTLVERASIRCSTTGNETLITPIQAPKELNITITCSYDNQTATTNYQEQPLAATEQPIEKPLPLNFTINKNQTLTINLSDYFSNLTNYTIEESNQTILNISKNETLVAITTHTNASTSTKIIVVAGNESIVFTIFVILPEPLLPKGVTQAPAVVGQPVTWTQITPEDETPELPIDAEKIRVRIGDKEIRNGSLKIKVGTKELPVEEYEELQSLRTLQKEHAEIKEERSQAKLLKKTTLYFDQQQLTKEIQDLEERRKELNITQHKKIAVLINDTDTASEQLTITYETAAPEQEEQPGKGRLNKKIKIHSNVTIHYYNISTFTDIEETAAAPRLYHYIDGEKIDITEKDFYNVQFKDMNNNGLYDRITWTVPMLSEQYFEVGLASINTKKPIYRPGETAEIIAVVLDNQGRLVSNANVTIRIVEPDNTTTTYTTNDSVIETQPGIYELNHTVMTEGTHGIAVAANADGVNNTMESEFTVQASYDYDIIRAPMTVVTDPWAGSYTMNISIVSHKTGTFSVTESLPSRFDIIDASDGSVTTDGTRKKITWNDVTNNSLISYTVDIPKISPQLYDLGKILIQNGNETFQEARPWYLAVDPVIINSTYDDFTTLNNISDYTNIRFSATENGGVTLQAKCQDETFEGGCWHYKVPFNVTDTSGTDQTNYTFNFTFDTNTPIKEGKMNGNCTDIRVTFLNSSSQEEQAYFWVEEGYCNTTSTTIWVQAPELNASSTEEFYLYYGEDGATDFNSYYDGEVVFDFFDDFNDGSLDTTTKWNGIGDYSFPVGEGYVEYWNTWGDRPSFQSQSMFANGTLVWRLLTTNTDGDFDGAVGVREPDKDGTAEGYFFMLDSRDASNCGIVEDNFATTHAQFGSFVPQSLWIRSIATFSGSDLTFWNDYHDITLTATDTTHTTGYIETWCDSDNAGGDRAGLDWILYLERTTNDFTTSTGTEEFAYASNGTITSTLVQPTNISGWQYLEVTHDIPFGTSISYYILDQNNNTLCTFETAEGITQYDLSGCAYGYNATKIYAELNSTDIKITPTIYDWELSWTQGQLVWLEEPSENLQTRYTDFLMNGTVQSNQDNCNISVYGEYKLIGTSDYFKEDEYDEFNSYTDATNVTITDAITLYVNTTTNSWYDQNWQSRLKLNVSLGATETDYPFKIQVANTDINFADTDSFTNIILTHYDQATGTETLLPHWVQYNDSSTATIWSKLDFSYNTNNTIFLYYNNDNYSSGGDGDSIFDFFDDFSGTAVDYSKWVDNEGTYAVSGGEFTGQNGNELEYVYSNTYRLTGDAIIEFTLRAATDGPGNTWEAGIGVGTWNFLDDQSSNVGIGIDTNRWSGLEASSGGGTGRTNAGSYHNFRVVINSGTVNFYDDTQIRTASTTGSPFGPFYLVNDGDTAGNADSIYDWVLVRPYGIDANYYVLDQEDASYYSAGTYNSSSFDTGSATVFYGKILADTFIPSNTDLKLYTRTSDDDSYWTAWSEQTPGTDISSTGKRYIQYLVEFESNETNSTSRLNSITINYYTAAPDFSQMAFDDTIFGATMPYECGVLNTTDYCYPTWASVTPKVRGKYNLRLNATSNCTYEEFSNQKILYVFANTQITGFTADIPAAGIGEDVTFTGTLEDLELGTKLADKTINLYEGSTYLATGTTDSSGDFSITYTIPAGTSIATHTYTADFEKDYDFYYNPSSANTNVKVSSKPLISDILGDPDPAGDAQTVTINATVTDTVGVDEVWVNITLPDSSSQSYQMTNVAGDNYSYDFTDTWQEGTYTLTITATNIDGITSTLVGSFDIVFTGEAVVNTLNDIYQNYEDVLLGNGGFPWTLLDWNHRQNLTVTNTVDTNATNFTLTLILNSSNVGDEFNWSSDQQSVRFYQYDGTEETKLGYYIQEWNAVAQNATILVRLEELPASSHDAGLGAGIAIINMYYGNPDATNESSINDAYQWYDDFEDNEISSSYGTHDADLVSGTSFTETGGELVIDAGGDDTWTGDDEYGSVYYLTKLENFDIRVAVISQENVNAWAKAGIMARNDITQATTSTGYSFMATTPSNGFAMQYDSDDNGYLDTNDNGGTPSTPDYLRLVREGSTFRGYYSHDDGDTWILRGTYNSNSDNPLVHVGLSVTSHAGTTLSEVHFDDLTIRSHLPVEPSIAFGMEEERNISAIHNTGDTEINGYLYALVQRWNGASWTSLTPAVINDRAFSNLRTINPGSYLDVASLWNPSPYNTGAQPSGTYRVKIALVDDSANPGLSTSVLEDSEGNRLEAFHNFTIKEAGLVLSNLTHENRYDHNLHEYETTDTIDWINVSVLAVNNTALDANVTLTLLDELGLGYVGFGPSNELKSYGQITYNTSETQQWDNSNNGYYIPLGIVSGTYLLNWEVDMALENGDSSENKTEYLKVHNLPDNFSVSTLDRLYVDEYVEYNFTIGNLWSENLTNTNVTLNCPSIIGLDCTCNLPAQSGNTCNLYNVSGLTAETAIFNITANNSVASGDYDINFTINYTNPANDTKSWTEIKPATLEVRQRGIFEIITTAYDATVTRGMTATIESYGNNTNGTTTANNAWLNYTYIPTNWTNITGSLSSFAASLAPGSILWNNVTFSVGTSAPLGTNYVALNTSSDNINPDYKQLAINVYGNTSIPSYNVNDTNASRGETVLLTARLVWDNGTAIAGETIYFYDQTDSTLIGLGVTNATGHATKAWALDGTVSTGVHTLNATYNGRATIYSWGSSQTTTIDIGLRPDINSLTDTPDPIGYGMNVTITANITDDDSIDDALVTITYPNGTNASYGLAPTTGDYYVYNFTDTWANGTYDYYVWTNDTTGSEKTSATQTFTLQVTDGLLVAVNPKTYNQSENVTLTDAIPWWNSNYQQRRRLTITNNDADDDIPQYYTYNFTLDTTGSDFQDDGDDVRIVYWNGTDSIELDRLGTGFNTSTTDILFLLQENVSINATDDNYYVYYDYASAVNPPENEGNVYFFYDDFDRANGDVGNGWTEWIDGGDVVGITSNKLSVNGNNVPAPDAGAKKSFGRGTIGADFEMSFEWYTPSNAEGIWLHHIGIGDSSIMANNDEAGGVGVGLYTGEGGPMSGTEPIASEPGTNLETNINGIFDYRLVADYSTETFDYYRDGTLRSSDVAWANSVTLDQIRVYTEEYGGGTAFTYDDLIIQLTVDTAPTSSLGNAETYSSDYSGANIDFRGKLIMKVQRQQGASWVDVTTHIDDTTTSTYREVSAGNFFDLPAIWNPSPWNTGVSTDGLYRVFAYLVNPYNNTLNTTTGPLERYDTFTILPPANNVTIDTIRIYEVNSSTRTAGGTLIDSGINKTFNIFANKSYRLEIETKNNAGSPDWDLGNVNATHSNLNESWYMSDTTDIRYKIGAAAAELSGTFTGGTVTWNTSGNGGTAAGNTKVTFIYAFNTTPETTTGDYHVHFLLEDPTFTKYDYSTLHVTTEVADAPKIYNDTYNMTETDVIRTLNTTTIYARWDQEIADADVYYNATIPGIVTDDVTLPVPNTQNWTNYTFSPTSSWLLGRHVAQVRAKNPSDIWNNSLPYLSFNVYGLAHVKNLTFNETSVGLGDPVQVTCEIQDDTKDVGIANYNVSIYVNGVLNYTALTNSTGFVSYSYAAPTFGIYTFECNITEQGWYKTDAQYTDSDSIFIMEYEHPKFHDVSGPIIAHKTDNDTFSTRWTDNAALQSATLATNASGSWTNVSSKAVSGNDSWANFTYVWPSTMTPGVIGWRQYGNDTSLNTNVTPIQSLEVWGWSKVSYMDVTPGSIQLTNYTNATCRVIDSNSSSGIQDYNVSFWDNGAFIGWNLTNSTGYARYRFNDSGLGIHTISCNITDQANIYYNDTTPNSGSDSLNVVNSPDVNPPYALSYGINDTSLLRGECFTLYAQWNEAINVSEAHINITDATVNTEPVPLPYTANWTNKTICTNNSWDVGPRKVKLWVNDSVGNINDTADYLDLNLTGRSAVHYVSPTGTINKGLLTLLCNVTDDDTNAGISGYTVAFYSDEEGSLGTNTTDSSGNAYFHIDTTTYAEGNEKFTCQIISSPPLFYQAVVTTAEETVVLQGSTANLTLFDQTDTVAGVQNATIARVHAAINFTANYSAGSPIDGNCNITFNDSVTGNMTFNGTGNGFYNYSRRFNATGNYTWNVSCTDDVFTALNASDWIYINRTTVDLISPVNGATIDRDSGSATMADALNIEASIHDAPSDINVTFYANRTDPTVSSNLYLGWALTNASGTATLSFNPDGTFYAGNHTFFANTTYGDENDTRNALIIGTLNLTFSYADTLPSASYEHNTSVPLHANITSRGPETAANLEADYLGSTLNAWMRSPTLATNKTTAMTRLAGNEWNASILINTTDEKGQWNASAIVNDPYFLYNATWRYVNITKFFALLSIWDQYDTKAGTITAYVGENITFHANYTSTSGTPITTANCDIHFGDATNSGMYYNTTWLLYLNETKIYSAGGHYTWNVTCNDSLYETLYETDTLVVYYRTNITITKSRISTLDNRLQFTINLTNNAIYNEYVGAYDFVPQNFTAWNYNFGPNATQAINDPLFIGTTTETNSTITSGDTLTLTYNTNATGTYHLADTFIIGG